MVQEDPSIIGSWRLTAFAVRPDVGEPAFPFGHDPEGSLIYTADGHVSAQIQRAKRPHFRDPDQMKGSPTEIEAAFKSFVSYYGTYHIDAEHGMVTHAVAGSMFPNWEGTEQVRFFSLAGDRLELRTPPTPWGGGTIIAELVWQRC